MPHISLHFLFSYFLALIPQPYLYSLLLFLPHTLQQQRTATEFFTSAWKSWAPCPSGILDTQLPSGSFEIKS